MDGILHSLDDSVVILEVDEEDNNSSSTGLLWKRLTRGSTEWEEVQQLNI